jgi:hypothetical protein
MNDDTSAEDRIVAAEPSAYGRARAARRACDVRAWARANGLDVAPTGGLPRFVYEMYAAAQATSEAPER